jgi:uncharacterized membrane protein
MIGALFSQRAKLGSYMLLVSLVLTGAGPTSAQDAQVQNAAALFDGARYAEALSQAEDVKRQFPNNYEAHYYAASSLLRLNFIERAEAAVKEAAKYAGPEKAQNQKTLEASLTRHRQADTYLKEAEAAYARGENYLAATNYTFAFDRVPYRYDVAQRAANLWENLDNFATAARLYKAMDKPNAGAIQQEARQFLKANAAKITALIHQLINAGWQNLGNANLKEARKSFEWALAVEPETSVHAGLGYVAEKSPYFGLMIAKEKEEGFDQALEVFKAAFSNGWRFTSKVFPLEGDAFAQALCKADNQKKLLNIGGPAAEKWAITVCEAANLAAESREKGFMLKICNKSSEARLNYAVAYPTPESVNRWTIEGWWSLKQGECGEKIVVSTSVSSMRFYVMGKGSEQRFPAIGNGDVDFCVSSKVMNKIVTGSAAVCPTGEYLASFKKVLVNGPSPINAVTLNFN